MKKSKAKSKMIIDRFILPVIDVAAVPFAIIASIVMKCFREIERREMHMRLTKRIFLKVGVWPILDHYYEPLFQMKHLRHSLRDIRFLPGIDLREDAQVALLKSFDYSKELNKLPVDYPGADGKFYFNNPSFGSGDSEILYSLIRKYKPSKIIEIGSGFSTLMASEAIKQNRKELAAMGGYHCEQICIEPYEMPWLEKTSATIIRERLEDVDKKIFRLLDEGDILFIDSSHMIRPQGDVLVEYLEILPQLKKGVLVHIHDVFTPRDYIDSWLYDRVRFWNEQYLMEAFLTCNDQYQVLLAVNYMTQDHFELISSRCPMLKEKRETGSFWIKRM